MTWAIRGPWPDETCLIREHRRLDPLAERELGQDAGQVVAVAVGSIAFTLGIAIEPLLMSEHRVRNVKLIQRAHFR